MNNAMRKYKWVGKFPSSVLDEIHELVHKIKGNHTIELGEDGEIILISDNPFDVGLAVECDLYLATLVR